MSKARDVMHLGTECIGEHGSLARAAEMMRDLHVGALPICGEDSRLRGIITDRDIVVRCIADVKGSPFDPSAEVQVTLAL